MAVKSPTLAEELLLPRTPVAGTPRDKPIGAILLDAGLIKLQDVERILAAAREKGLRFGDAAVALGLIRPGDLHGALAYQFDYPVLAPGSTSVSREVISAFEARHPVLNDVHALRSQVLLRWLTHENAQNRAIAVISPESGDGRTFVAANLAVAFSQMGQRTLLVDANMRRPRIHDLFGIDNQAGLSALLADRRVSNALKRIDGLRDLSVIPAGGEPPNPHDLLSRDSFEEMLAAFSQIHDVIVIDTPAARHSPDAEVVAVRARGSILLGRHNRSRVADLAGLAQQVQSLGGTIVGSVLVRA